MTRVGIVAEPLGLSCAIEAAMRAEPDIQVVSLLLGAGDGGAEAALEAADVLLVSVSPAADVEALGRAWNTWRSPRLVLLDVGPPDTAALRRRDQATEPVVLSDPSRRKLVAAVRAMQDARRSWAPRIALHLAPLRSRDPLPKDELPPRADPTPLIAYPVDDRASHRRTEGRRRAG